MREPVAGLSGFISSTSRIEAGSIELVRRWVRVACISYDPAYGTYLGRLRKNQSHPFFKDRATALPKAAKEIHTIERMGFKAKIWVPLPAHRDSGHIHIVALIKPSQLRRLFPTEYYGPD